MSIIPATLGLSSPTLPDTEKKGDVREVQAEVGDDFTKQIQRVYQLAFSREPSDAEIADAKPIVQSHGLTALCRAVFNSNEFLFIP